MKYTVMRLALFVAALAVFALLGAGGWLLVVLAALVSFALSYVLLRRPREELTQVIAARADPTRPRRPRRQGRLSRQMAEDEAVEDDAVDHAAADDDRPPGQPDAG